MTDVNGDIPDERLISATLAGDDEAFARLVRRYKRRIFDLAARFARDRDELEDICQEVFIKAYEKLASFRYDAPFGHWLSKIAVHSCHDTLRTRHRERQRQPLSMCTDLEDHAETARSEARQARELLRQALGQLHADEQLIITLLELEELTVKEAAELTGWSEANVKVRAHRARQALKKIVEKYDA